MSIEKRKLEQTDKQKEQASLVDLGFSAVGIIAFIACKSMSDITVAKQFLLAIVIYIISCSLRQIIKAILFKLLGSADTKISFNYKDKGSLCFVDKVYLPASSFKFSLVTLYILFIAIYFILGIKYQLLSVMLFNIFWHSGFCITDLWMVYKVGQIKESKDCSVEIQDGNVFICLK